MKFTNLRINDLVSLIYKEPSYINIEKLCNYFLHRIETLDLLEVDELKNIEILIDILNEKVLNKDKKVYKKLINYMGRLVNLSKDSLIELEIPELKKLSEKLENICNHEIFDVLRRIIKILSRKKISYRELNINMNVLLEQKNIDMEYLDVVDSLINYIKNDKTISTRIGSLEKYNNFLERFHLLHNRFIKKEKKKYFDESLLDSVMVLSEPFSNEVINSIKMIALGEDVDNSERILSIDKPLSPDLDGAFSVGREDNNYVFKVYITNVPSFLKENYIIAKEAYKKGVSSYIKNDLTSVDIHLDMLPPILSWDKLSLHQNYFRNAIVFEYLINDSGVVLNTSVTIKKIKVEKNFSPDEVINLLSSKESLNPICNDLKLYQEIALKVLENNNKKYLKNLDANKIEGLIAFPSVLTNYFIGENSEFAIYRVGGKYRREKKGDYYTHSVTPLRRFVSNINLAFFLNQYGIEKYDKKMLNYVEKNIDEILEHLNNQTFLSEYIKRHPHMLKKILIK